MKRQRMTQNFRDYRSSLVTPDSRAIATLQAVLPRLGVTVDIVQPTLPLIGAEGPRIIFIDGDAVAPAVDDDHAITAECAIVGLVGSEAPSRLRVLVSLGAQAFLPKPVHGGSIYSALFLAVNSFNRSMAMQTQIDDLHQRRKDRAHVLHAVTDLVLREGIGADEAYDRLRRSAMQARRSIETHCQMLRALNSNEDKEASPADDMRRRA